MMEGITGAETVNFVGINLSIRGILHNAMFGYGSSDATGKAVHVIGEILLPADCGHDLTA